MEKLVHLGDLDKVLPLAAALTAWLLAARAWRITLRWLLLFGAALGVVGITKIAFLGWGIGLHALDFKAISGHATCVTALYPFFAYVVLYRPDLAESTSGAGTVVQFGTMANAANAANAKHAANAQKVADAGKMANTGKVENTGKVADPGKVATAGTVDPAGTVANAGQAANAGHMTDAWCMTKAGGMTKTGGMTEAGGMTKTRGMTEAGGITKTGGMIRAGRVIRAGGMTKAGDVTNAGAVASGESVIGRMREITGARTWTGARTTAGTRPLAARIGLLAGLSLGGVVSTLLVTSGEHSVAEALAGWLLGAAVSLGGAMTAPDLGGGRMLPTVWWTIPVFALAASLMESAHVGYWMIRMALALSGSARPYPWDTCG